jgi:hypothetical protein
MESTVTQSKLNSLTLRINAESEFESIDVDLRINAEEEIFGEKVGLFARLFGCRHNRMSKPVTVKNTTYKFCPSCGIRRRYNLETFKFQGAFYYPTSGKDLHHV